MTTTLEAPSTLEGIRKRLTQLDKELHQVGYPPAPDSKFAQIGNARLMDGESELLAGERDRRYEAASREYNFLKSAESAALARSRAEAARQRLAELIAGDADVTQAAERHAQALAVAQALTDELRKVKSEIEKRRGAAVESLNEAPLARLLGAAKNKAGATDELRAYELTAQELRQRLATAEARAGEMASELQRVQRSVVHRHIDELIASSRSNLTALNDVLREIMFWEEQVRLLGGRRQPFLSLRVQNDIEGVCERLDGDIANTQRLSEPY